MASTSYERGRAAEYRAVKELREAWYAAIRTAGSHGIADVIAWNANHIRFIQIKTYIKKCPSFEAEQRSLYLMELPPSAQSELWIRQVGARKWDSQAVIRVTPVTLVAPVTPYELASVKLGFDDIPLDHPSIREDVDNN